MKADLHMHTYFSDGISSPEEMVESAIAKGLDCICITDHSETKGAIKAIRYSYDKNILVVPGIEILSKSGDVLGINIKKRIYDGLSFEETIKEIHKQKGIAVIPHPFGWPSIAGFWESGEKICQSKIDAIEIFNATVVFPFSNSRAMDFSFRNNFAFTAGSDAHRSEFVGRGYIETKEDFFSEKDLIEKILSKKAEAKGRILNKFEIIMTLEKGDMAKCSVYYRKRFKKLAENKVFEI